MNKLPIQKIFSKIKKFLISYHEEKWYNGYCMSSIKLAYCKDIERERKTKIDGERRLAHTGHEGGIICISKELSEMPYRNIIGVLLHEFGHILTDLGDEKVTDEYIHKTYGIEIKYDSELELQYVNEDVVEEIIEW